MQRTQKNKHWQKNAKECNIVAMVAFKDSEVFRKLLTTNVLTSKELQEYRSYQSEELKQRPAIFRGKLIKVYDN